MAATKGDKVYLKAKPQFFKPAGEPISGFYRNGAVPNDSIVNDWITDNYNDCSYLGEVQKVNNKDYYLIRLNFTYREHSSWLGIGKDVKSSEDLWFLEEDFSFEYVKTAADIKAEEKKAALNSLLNDANGNLTAASTTTSTTSKGWLIGGIIAGAGVLIGVLVWAFGKNKNNPSTPPPPPTIINLSKPKKP